jgi:hypothetical protein
MPLPEMKKNVIVVFTARSPERIIEEGGSQAWALNRARAKDCEWLICTQNRHNPDEEFSDATEPHGSGFLIGKITAIRKSEEGDGSRWMIAIDQYARVSIPDLWNGQRFPVSYRSLRELHIDPEEYEFETRSIVRSRILPAPSPDASSGVLTIAEAKKQLAATFGVKPEAVEITIRG